MDEAFRLVERRAAHFGWHGRHTPQLSADDISAFESRTGRRIPTELRELLLWYDDNMWARALNPDSLHNTDMRTVLRPDGTPIQPGDPEDERDDPVRLLDLSECQWVLPSQEDAGEDDLGPIMRQHVEIHPADPAWLDSASVMFAESAFFEFMCCCDSCPDGAPRVWSNIEDDPLVLFSAPTLAVWLARLAMLGFEVLWAPGCVEDLPSAERAWVIDEFSALNPLSEWFR